MTNVKMEPCGGAQRWHGSGFPGMIFPLIIGVWILLPVLLCQNAFATNVSFGKVVEGFDIVMVFDTSASMNDADEQSAAKNAASMFLDSLFIKGSENQSRPGVTKSAVGLVAYNDSARQVSPILKVTSEEAIKTLQDAIYKFDYTEDKGDAALGSALSMAVDMLADVDDGMEKRVILFTDGYTASGETSASGNSDPLMPYFGGATQNDLETALKKARNIQCQIYIIGLDYEGSLTPYWPEYQKIANYTQLKLEPWTPPPASGAGGATPPGTPSSAPAQGSGAMAQSERWIWTSGVFTRENDGMEAAVDSDYYNALTQNGELLDTENDAALANYTVARSVVDVQSRYADLNAVLMTGTSPKNISGEISNGQFSYSMKVETMGNSAALFYILSDSRIEQIQLEGPSGPLDVARTDADGWNRDSSARVRWWQGYTTVTAVDPDPGMWTLRVTGTNPNVRYIIVGGLTLSVTAERIGESAEGRVVAKILRRLTPMDEEFYNNLIPDTDYECKVSYQGTPDTDIASLTRRTIGSSGGEGDMFMGEDGMPPDPSGAGQMPPDGGNPPDAPGGNPDGGGTPPDGQGGGNLPDGQGGGNPPDAPGAGQMPPDMPGGGGGGPMEAGFNMPRISVAMTYDPEEEGFVGNFTVPGTGLYRVRFFLHQSGVDYDMPDYVRFTEPFPDNPVPVPDPNNPDNNNNNNNNINNNNNNISNNIGESQSTDNGWMTPAIIVIVILLLALAAWQWLIPFLRNRRTLHGSVQFDCENQEYYYMGSIRTDRFFAGDSFNLYDMLRSDMAQNQSDENARKLWEIIENRLKNVLKQTRIERHQSADDDRETYCVNENGIYHALTEEGRLVFEDDDSRMEIKLGFTPDRV